MSRARSYAPYGASTPPPPPPGYYYDDMEGYVGDYSESDGLSDGTPHVVTASPPDVTEIYRRKTVPQTMPTAMPPPTAQIDYHAVYAPQEYYYDATQPQAGIPSRRPTVAYRKRIPLERTTARYYSPADSGELYADATMGFRSTHQMMPNVPRNLPPRVPSSSAVRPSSMRRHPITVRTPRFYRRPGSTTLYKRPSALCLPVACQPDPAVYKRTKRSSNDQIYTPEYVYQPAPIAKVAYASEKPKSAPRKVPQDPSGSDYNDLNVTKSKLDAALQRYEQIFEKNGADVDHRYPDAKIAQMLKPKVPQTIKEKRQEQEKQNTQVQEKKPEEKHKMKSRKYPKIDWSKARILEVEGAESDALEKILLADLKANGMVESDDLVDNKSERKGKSPVRPEKKSEKLAKVIDANPEIALKDLPKSFNYQEIQNVVVKTKQHQQNQQNQQQSEMKQYNVSDLAENIPPSKKCSRTNLAQDQLMHISDTPYSRPASAQGSQISSKRQPSTENIDKTSDCKSVRAGVVPRVLVDDALELHRTKSYVVNLIDHALSNHFGTNLCEKYSTKDNPIDPRVAMELLKKHSSCKVNKDVNKEMCLEIAQALADTFNSTTSYSTMAQTDPKQDSSTCTCNKHADEPLYVKQLKQLRWGHLKHIQREVRRLEDLERFLDSCTSNNFS